MLTRLIFLVACLFFMFILDSQHHCLNECFPGVLQELEESYQKFQSRINQMELNVYPSIRSLDLQIPTQSSIESTSFE